MPMAWMADELARMNFITPMRDPAASVRAICSTFAQDKWSYILIRSLYLPQLKQPAAAVYRVQPSRNCRPMNWLPDCEWCHSRGSRSNLHGAILFYPRIQGPACVSSRAHQYVGWSCSFRCYRASGNLNLVGHLQNIMLNFFRIYNYCIQKKYYKKQ